MHNKTWGNCSGVFRVSGARGRSNEVHTVTPLPQICFRVGMHDLKVNCNAVDCLMPKQVDNQSRESLFEIGYFDSFIKLYHTEFSVP